jgi:hypothetical protein
MLPFLKPKLQTGVLMKTRQADTGDMPEDDSGDDAGLTACAEDLIQAVHAKDAAAVRSAFQSMCELLDKDEPSAEEPTEPSESIEE